MSKPTLDNLFGSKLRVKVLKFLFRNYPNDFSIRDVAKFVQESYDATKMEIESLKEIGLVRKK
ncbi:MAG: hypothetical protein A3G02_00075 [Candidatus Yanofskybacteria bacterium RIFCSPLOWO2_12_FULL_44_13b]|uniref:HTH arsR-type domain-containing protein n=1 Tax=Candidatus Yanofskybacteria bacterium RIFCSPLOWO2_02_FULL_44_18 TaxID=1802705 RepID=A0A1F8H214_9BACT|nr:MAG: hypothetical protein A3C01_00225 [Candidatus Yanofskybacteria bacterium RIFCSPHIGHO2_02_FULL_44_36b]OGN30789.1 MAG: hypothetical protein A3I96_03070 [Candidatus Yanofskybacteria bacterium RIFCSPLOWO2_02_FULL_44_18]OGN35447.1 MAG: hypothetical protein A3G02_00075 [Candidatus Yanofskybacteria bacterium RIFCSPLOWO2_12_FULL_44_13b]